MRSDDEILKAIAKAESGGDPNAIGKSGEVGQYQFMPDTIRQLGGDPARLKGNAAAQDELARKHLASLRAKYGEDDNKIIAAWNAGEGGVDAAVKKGGPDWQKNLPKGTNRFGAQYDTGAYVQRVNQNFSQEPMPQQTQQSEPQAQQQPTEQQQPSVIPISVAGGPEQTLAEEYHARRKAELMQWMMQDDQPEAPKPEAPKPKEQPKEQGGGLINAIGSGIKTLASALSAPGKGLADALYPAHPQGRGPQDQGPVEGVIGAAGRSVGAGINRMAEGVSGSADLLSPSPEEAARRSQAPIGEQLMGLLKGAGDMLNATPVGGLLGAANQVGKEATPALSAMSPDELSDEGLKAQIAKLDSYASISDPVKLAEAKKHLEGLLMMPHDERVQHVADVMGQVTEAGAGALPLPFTLGIFGGIKKVLSGSEAAVAGVKAARQAVIARAAEKAVEPAAHVAGEAVTPLRVAEPAPTAQQAAKGVGGPRPPLTLKDLQRGMQQEATPGVKAGAGAPGQNIAPEVMTIEKLTAQQRLAMIERDAAAKAAIDETIAETAPTSAPGRARVEGLTERERLRQEGRTDIGAEPRSAQPEPKKPSGPIAPWPGEISGASAVAEAPANEMVTVYRHGAPGETAFFGESEGLVSQYSGAGKLHSVEVPAQELEKYRASNILADPHADPKLRAEAELSGMPDREFVLPSDLAKGATEHAGPKGLGTREIMADPNVSFDAKVALAKELGIPAPKRQPAPEQMYREVRDLMHGDPDLTEAALRSRGYTLPELGEQESNAVREVMETLDPGSEKSVRLYHGSRNTFETFDPARATHGVGFYFTENKKLANAFTAGKGANKGGEFGPHVAFVDVPKSKIADIDALPAGVRRGADMVSDLKSQGFAGYSQGKDWKSGAEVVLFEPERWRPGAAAAEALHGVAADLGIVPEAGIEALPAVNRIMKALGEGNLKTVREIVAEALKNPDNPLSALRAAQMGGAEAGRINAGTLFVISRAALGGVAGAMVGEDPQDRVRNVLIGAGIGLAASPKLARIIADNIMKPEVREALTNALTLHGEEGALRFPARGVGKNPPNLNNMGTGPEAKRLVRGVNEKLEKLGMLHRAEEQSHAMTEVAARHSEYSTVEKVLSLDAAKMSPDELATAGLAAGNVRDAVAESAIEAAARLRLNPGDAALEQEVVAQTALLARASQQVTNLKTAYGRALNALGIETDVTAASKFDLKQFTNDIEAFKGALTDQGKVSPAQLAEMIGQLADKAAAAKIASVASKWPPALWNIYYGLNLLSSPLTHARNIIGNTGALGMAIADRAGGELLGAAYRALGKDASKTVALGETYHMISGIVDTIADSFRAAVPKGGGAFGMGAKTYKTGLSKFEGGNKYTEALNAATAQQAMQAEQGSLPMIIQTMSTLGRKNMALMSGVDEFYKVLSFEGEMRALARRNTQHLVGDARREAYESLLADPTRDMLHGAEEFAQENTFTKAFKPTDDKAGAWGKLVGTDKGGALFGAGPQAQAVMNNPLAKVFGNAFFRTPARIGEFSSVHTPVLNLLAPQFWSDMTRGGVKQQLAMSKVAVGMGMMTVAGWYAAHGYLTGAAPSDPGLRKKLEATGWQEFSAYVPDWVPGGGRYVSYANIEPISTIVGTIATFMQIAPDMDEGAIQDFFSAGVLAIGKNSLRQQWWQGFSDLSDMVQAIAKDGNAKAAVTWATRKAATAMPGGAAFRYVQNATDPVKHDPEVNEWKKLVDIFAQNAPGWGGRNALELTGYKPRPAALNGLTGEEVPNENQWIGLVSPFRVSAKKDDVVINKIVDLAGAGLPKDLIPHVIAGDAAPSPFKLQGQNGQSEEERLIKEGVTLDNEQYHRLSVLLTRETKDSNGNTMHDAMEEAINSPEFEDLKGGPDGGQANQIRKIYHQFLKNATRQLREEYPDINYAIMRRKLERDGRRMPKSMDWMLNEGRQQMQQDATAAGVR